MPSSCSKTHISLLVIFLFSLHLCAHAGDLDQNIEINWGNDQAQMLNSGQLLTLSLDRASGSGFQSKNEYLFGKFHMQLKLVPGNSAGTVTTYYLRSQGSTSWDEIDFEFLGNLSGDPYILHTNIYTQGNGNREQQFYLWFDPTADFHTYSILWNPQFIIFYVDDIPIREYKNSVSIDIPFPTKEPMRIHGSLWDGEGWATRGGSVKTNWTEAPFTASYRNFSANACVWSSGASPCAVNSSDATWMTQVLDPKEVEKLKWVVRNHMIYDYCADSKRFPDGFPPECAVTVIKE